MSEGLRDIAEFDKPREACGVFGIYTIREDLPVARITVEGIYELQHRGQDAAGVFINDTLGNMAYLAGNKDVGLVPAVFPDSGRTLDALHAESTIGVGHVRYGTVDVKDRRKAFDAAQPLLGEDSIFALAHNGHIENMDEIAESYGLKEEYMSDSEGLTKVLNKVNESYNDIVTSMHEVLPKLEGSYSLCVTDGKRLIGVRDGTRPLCIGKRKNEDTYVIASEDSALSVAEADFVRDIQAGEVVIIDESGINSEYIKTPMPEKMCAFEFIYNARGDSTINGRNVHLSREDTGRILALEAPADADIVIGIPETGISAAMGYAKEANIPYELGVFRNPYAVRSFISATQEKREREVRRKLRPNTSVIADKRLVVVDDSVIRGTTMKAIVSILREAGANEVHLRVPSMPYTWPCFAGMDTGRPEELLARKFDTTEEMKDYLGVDSLAFVSKEGLIRGIALPLGSLCMACMDGNYPKPVPANVVFRGLLDKVTV